MPNHAADAWAEAQAEAEQRTRDVDVGAYVYRWADGRRWRVQLAYGLRSLACSREYADRTEAEREQRRVQRIVDREAWDELAALVREHAGQGWPFGDDPPPLMVEIADVHHDLSDSVYAECRGLLRRRGLDLETDDVGVRVVVRPR
jgi:hypothetical protein